MFFKDARYLFWTMFDKQKRRQNYVCISNSPHQKKRQGSVDDPCYYSMSTKMPISRIY